MWIDVNDRLPQPDQVVLITGWRDPIVHPDKRFVAVAVHSTRHWGDFFDGDTGDVFYPATHWMMIPTIEDL